MAEVKAEQSHIGQCMRILVVEDDTFVREAMRMMIETIEKESAAMYAKQELALRPTKLQAEYTMTGEQGWDMLRSRRFDIALIDLNLPGVSGLDLSWCYQQMQPGAREEDHTAESGGSAADPQQQPTILIACSSDLPTDGSLSQYGIHDVLPKPVTMKALRHVMHKWLPRASAVEFDLDALQLSQPASLQRNRSGIFAGRILLVEDCVVTRTATELVFQQLGLCADLAADGTSAMDQLLKRDYDLILMDVDLPDMSGYALCSWYKGFCRSGGRACGYVAAVTSDPDLKTSEEFEMDACLAKPLTTLCLVEGLKDFWRSRGQATNASRAAEVQPAQSAAESADLDTAALGALQISGQ